MAALINQPPPVKQTNYLPWFFGGCGVLLVFWIVVVIAAFAIYYYKGPSANSRSGERRSSSSGVRLVEDHGIPTVQKTWSSCMAYAPADWTIIGSEERVGMGVDLTSVDRSMAASYGITGAAGGAYYGMSTPENYIQKMMQTANINGFEFESRAQQVDGYTLRYWRGDSQGKPVRGFAMYVTFNTDDPNTYIIALRMGSTEASKWEEQKHVVYDAAASIRCTKHLFPAQESSTREPRGSSKDKIESDLSTKREEAMMGFQNVYSPTTGEHWEASYSDYNATGPDGPGYYRKVGNVGGYEKLSEGFPPN